jgi:hypothetical protein
MCYHPPDLPRCCQSPFLLSHQPLLLLILLLRLLMFLPLFFACDETAVMADKNVLSSSEDTQFDDSEAPNTTSPNAFSIILHPLYPDILRFMPIYPYTYTSAHPHSKSPHPYTFPYTFIHALRSCIYQRTPYTLTPLIHP